MYYSGDSYYNNVDRKIVVVSLWHMQGYRQKEAAQRIT